ncbi:uncharacterized protein LOC116738632 isoform X2 [Nasonia vitripennis]|uniref:Uncharacterized protein n=1 Tax=Nasonia vitripennis TaxID=7425 RepID=A0A7M7R0B8_NASVI|nr:uncharacterized protein LOC116738632 isoform X2 [Nasonia vitripennis]
MVYYAEYYADQIGGGDGGGGVRRVFAGSTYQRGHGGIGSFLSGLFRRVLPYITSGAKAVGKEAIRAGMHVLDDVGNHGSNFKQAVNMRMRESGKNLKHKAADKIAAMMKGSGYKIRAKKRKRQSSKNSSAVRISSKSGRVKKKKKKKKSRVSVRKSTKKKAGKNKPRKKRKQRSVSDIFGST